MGSKDKEMLAVGDKAPKFKLSATLSEKKLSLKKLRGKIVILYFYPKDHTSGCTKEACDFRDRLERLNSYDVAVIGVSKDSLKSHHSFSDKHQLNFPLVADTDLEIIKAYGVAKDKKVIRSTFLIDTKGKIAKIWHKVKVDGHVDEVLAAVEELKGIKKGSSGIKKTIKHKKGVEKKAQKVVARKTTKRKVVKKVTKKKTAKKAAKKTVTKRPVKKVVKKTTKKKPTKRPVKKAAKKKVVKKAAKKKVVKKAAKKKVTKRPAKKVVKKKVTRGY